MRNKDSGFVPDFPSKAKDHVPDFLSKAKDLVPEFLSKAKDHVPEFLSKAKDPVPDFLSAAKDPVRDFLSAAKDLPLILLAAGKSTRMGTPKGLLDFHGEPWLIAQLKRFASAGGKKCIIVLGYHCARYFEKLPWLSDAILTWQSHLNLQVSVVINSIPYLGSFSSLQHGLRWVTENSLTQAYVQPIDVPVPEQHVFVQLHANMAASTLASVPVYQEHKGHPVFISAAFMQELLRVDTFQENARLDWQLHSLAPHQLNFPYVNDPAIVYNLNTIHDWQNFCIQS